METPLKANHSNCYPLKVSWTERLSYSLLKFLPLKSYRYIYNGYSFNIGHYLEISWEHFQWAIFSKGNFWPSLFWLYAMKLRPQNNKFLRSKASELGWSATMSLIPTQSYNVLSCRTLTQITFPCSLQFAYWWALKQRQSRSSVQRQISNSFLRWLHTKILRFIGMIPNLTPSA